MRGCEWRVRIARMGANGTNEGANDANCRGLKFVMFVVICVIRCHERMRMESANSTNEGANDANE